MKKHVLSLGCIVLGATLALTCPVMSRPVLAAPVASGTVQVDVKDALGRPLAGAAVSLKGPGNKVVAEGTTDASGQYRFTGLAAGQYRVEAAKATFQSGAATTSLADGETASVALTLATAQALSLETQNQRLDKARNGLSPETGTSQYRMDRKAIAELPRGERTPVNQVLLQAPGVVQSNFGQIFVRGDHGNMQYRLNGVLLPEGITGFGNTLDTRFADKVDFLTGALPAQYGYRTAGVVNIQTKTGSQLSGARLDLDGGSYGWLEPSAQIGGTAGPFDYYLSGSYLQNDIGIDPPSADATPFHDHTTQGKGFGYFSATLNPDLRASLILGTSLQRFDVPTIPGQTPDYKVAGTDPIPSEKVNDSLQPLNHYGILALQGVVGDTFDYQLAGFGRYSGLTYTPDPIGDLQYGGVAALLQRNSTIGGLQGDASWKLHPAHTLRFGTFLSAESAQVNNTSQVFPADADGKQTSETPVSITDNNSFNSYLFGLYAQDEWKVVDQLTLNGGLRFDAIGGLVTGAQVSPRLGLVYTPWASSTIHAGYARYYTPPTTELIGLTTFDKFNGTTAAMTVPAGNNPNPLPESTNYFDIGWLQQITPALSLGLDGYYKDVQNLQDEGQFGNALVYQTFNYQTGRIMGVEATGSYRQDDLSAYLNVAVSRATARGLASGQYNFDDDELDYIAKNDVTLDHDQTVAASAGVTYTLFETRLSANALFGSGLPKGFANSERLPAYWQVNLGASRQFNIPVIGTMEARASVQNLFDLSYVLRDGTGIGMGLPAYGQRRAFYLGLTKFF